ncbi:M56 family metallopeptidase [uncultured Oscillibacter sp.]|uniref:M56 family metallopeptidase n=1 Tax=uncultured Oscillibacter sp. TaxID=876091 RepID=UPI0025FA2E91|nr:M56 family metallopeptidase [uncultured Oscillibacter sp.]
MKDVLLTSSVLILALLVLRRLFRRTIPRRAQYALWALVLVRLLVPVSLPAVEHNVLTAAAPVRETISSTLETQALYIPMEREPLEEHPTAPDLSPERAMPPAASSVWVVGDDETAVRYRRLDAPAFLLQGLWLSGAAVMTALFLAANLRFWKMLRRRRTPCPVEGCRYPVYLVAEGLPSPCLFGFPRPAIYLTPAACASPERLRHVIAHETTHARHLDPLWSLLRCVCLAVYWFNPLVWAAAAASKADCELACDEGALRRLGEAERIPYGQTLLTLIPVQRGPGSPLLSATTMTAGKRQLRDRITRIAGNPQTAAVALFAAVALAALVCMATFTGPKAPGDLSGFTRDTSVSLAEAEPWTAEAVPVMDMDAGDVSWVLDRTTLADGTVVGYGYLEDRSVAYWYADSAEAETLHRFLLCPPTDFGGYAVKPVFDLLGRDGFRAAYEAGEDLEPYAGEGGVYEAWRYYYFDGGRLYLLATAPGTVTENPWPGTLLACTGVEPGVLLYFQRGGNLYRAELTALTAAAYPGWKSIGMAWDDGARLLCATGYRSGDYAMCRRYGALDGAELVFYRDARPLDDHVLGTTEVPDDVLDAARRLVARRYEDAAASQDWFNAYDDWRIEHLEEAYTYSPADGSDFWGREIEVYQLNYEFHTSAPLADVPLAGGMYVTEDGWVCPTYPDCTYLLFQVENGKRTFLYAVMENDCSPGTPLFTEDMERTFLENGELTVAGMTPESLWTLFRQEPAAAISRLSSCYDDERDLGCRALSWEAAALDDAGRSSLFQFLNGLGLTGRDAQTLDLLRYHAGDLSYDTLPQEVLGLYTEVAAAYAWGRRAAAPYLYFISEEHRDLELNSGADVPQYLQLEYGRWINPGLYAVVVRVTDADGRLKRTPHNYCFAALIDGRWQWVGNVDYLPAELRQGLDAARYDYFDPSFLGTLADTHAELTAPEQPPTESELHRAILASRRRATGHTFDFYAEAHRVLDEKTAGDTYTAYLMVHYAAYTLSNGVWTADVDGQFPAAATFTARDGKWALSEYWEPRGGGQYGPDIQANFTETAADALFSDGAGGWWDGLAAQCRDAADRHFSEIVPHTVASLSPVYAVPGDKGRFPVLQFDSYGAAHAYVLGQLDRTIGVEESVSMEDGTTVFRGAEAHSLAPVLYLVDPSGTAARLPAPKTASSIARNLRVDGYTFTYQYSLADYDDRACFAVEPRSGTYSVTDVSPWTRTKALPLPQNPPSYEETLAQLTASHTIVQQWEGEEALVVEAAEQGAPHADSSLYLVLKTGGILNLPDPPRVGMWETAELSDITFSEGRVVYLASFDHRAGTFLGGPEEDVYHEAGTYTYDVNWKDGVLTESFLAN